MKVNWFGYFPQYDGYGRFSSRLATALRAEGVEVFGYHCGVWQMPQWMVDQQKIDWNHLSISCMPPYMLEKIPGRHWLYTMTEGSRIPVEWVEKIESCGVERVIVPCQHNQLAFIRSGVRVPVCIVPGGVDPLEFSVTPPAKPPYTFLTFADRGFRKGWEEVQEAFYLAFGGKTTGIQDVRLLIKSRSEGMGRMLRMMRDAKGADSRIVYLLDDTLDMREVYDRTHCLALPSRSEGWGMIHREAAVSGIPVITQAYAGLDDGFTSEWALVVEHYKICPIPEEVGVALGEWRIVDVQELSEKMHWCYVHPKEADFFGLKARFWLKNHQTWNHAAKILKEMIANELRVERAALPLGF